MANVKISQLPAASAALGTQEFEVNESGTSKKVTGAQVSTYVRGQLTLGDFGVTATSSELNVLDGITSSTAELNILDGVTATATELNYVDGVTSSIQTQLDAKVANTTQDQATWEAGTSTTETIVSPAKVKAEIVSTLNASGSAPVYACRAWVNFRGTGTVAIRASGNVSSITDNGTGDYTVNFTTAMPDANYAAVFGGQGASFATYAYATGRGNVNTLQQTTTTLRVLGVDGFNSAADLLMVSVAIFR